MNRAVLNSTGNSGPSVGASSMVTDANSALSGGPHLQRSASINTESYLRLPASPMSFSSNNMGSSVMDGSSIVQQSSHQDQTSQQRQRGASTATSQPASHTSPHALAALTQEPNYLSQMQKKPRLDIKQEDILQPQVIQQMFQRQEPIQLQGHNPQLQALIQQQRLLQRHQHPPQQILQSMPQIQRANLQQQLQQQQQMRQHVQQQGVQPPLSGMKRPFESGVCARRLMQYIYHQRHRPADNTIVYWRKFVAEYYAPRARKRWCLSLYDNVGQHALGVFPQAAMDAWQCDICGSKSGRGFEATFEVLPRLSKIKFDSGVIDELLFVDMPREYRFPSGIMMLEYGKAVQESVYEQLRVVREGQLRIAFTPDLKILSWEFCARHHEELLPRRFVAPQVNQLLQVAQKYQTTVTESGSSPVSPQDLQANCNMFLSAGRQLARNLELQSLNDLGFSKRYVRCLQISEVVNSMKDLIDFCREKNIGPIESLKNYPRQAGTAKFQIQKMQEMEQQTSSAQGGLPNDRNTMNQVTSMHSGTSSHVNNNNNHMMGNGVLGNSAQASVALNNYQNLLRQNSMNSNTNVVVKQEGSCSLNSSNQAQQTSPFQGSMSLIPGPMQNVQVNGLSSPHQSQNQHHPLNANLILQQQNHPQSSNNGNPNLQHHMIQQLLQEMMNNNGGGRTQQPPTPGGHNMNRTLEEDVFNAVNGKTVGGLPVKAGSTGMVGNGGVGFANNSAASIANVSGGGIIGGIPNRSNSFKSNANSNSSSMVSGNNENFNLKASDVLQNLHLPDISHEFSEWDV